MPTGAQQVLYLGDSVTVGRPAFPEVASPNYFELVQDHYPGGVNAAVGGSSSQDWVPGAPFYQSALSVPADLVVLLIGGNDAMGTDFLGEVREPVPGYEFSCNLHATAYGLLAAGFPAVLLMTPYKAFSAVENLVPGQQARLHAYRLRIKDLCAEDERIVCGPDLWWEMEYEHFRQPFAVHPTAAGHAFIASLLIPALDTFFLNQPL